MYSSMSLTVLNVFRKPSSGEPLRLFLCLHHLGVLKEAAVQVRGAALAEAHLKEVGDTAEDFVLVVKTWVFTLREVIERSLSQERRR